MNELIFNSPTTSLVMVVMVMALVIVSNEFQQSQTTKSSNCKSLGIYSTVNNFKICRDGSGPLVCLFEEFNVGKSEYFWSNREAGRGKN